MTRTFAASALAGAAALALTIATAPGVAAAPLGLSIAGFPGATAYDRSQLAAGVGLTPAEAQHLTLSQLAAMEFDRSSDQDNQMMAIHPGNTYATPQTVRMSSRSPTTVNAQLIAGAGLSQQDAQSMTLNDVAKQKFGRDNSL